MAQHTLFIDGHWLAAQGEPMESENPCTGDLIWRGAAAAKSDLDLAIGAARAALANWAPLTLAQRIEFLRQYQRLLQDDKASLAETIARETGKPTWESLGEVASMIGKVDLSIEAYETRSDETVKNADGVCSRVRHKPHGVIAVFGPYNFPGHLPNGHIVPALLAGNTVVFKPSELTPQAAEHMIRLWSQADLPAGVINLVQGAKATGIALARHKGIDGLFFTGSSRTGRALHKHFAGDTRKILALEMGGNNPLIVHEAEDLSAAVYYTLQSAYVTAGQRCTCARRLIVPRGAQGDAFIDKLLAAMDKIVVGCPGSKPDPFMGPVISNAAAQALLKAQAELAELGGKLLRPMRRTVADRPLLSPGLIDLSAVRARPDEEYFGPLLQLIRVDDFATAIDEANATRYGLAAGILTDNPRLWELFYQRSRAGVVNWNRPLTGASGAAPFGGIGASGNHRPSAYYAADYSAYPVASLEAQSLQLPDTLAPGVSL